MRRLALVPLVVALLGAPGPAFGKDEGIVVDPSTPTGKEYAIPLDQARQEAVGKSRGAHVGGGDTRASAGALFGEGIRVPTRSDARHPGPAGALGGSQPEIARSTSAVPSAAALAGETHGGRSGGLATLGIPAGVLLAGGALALLALLRRRLSR
jgi:hypothetical protein